MTDTGQPLNPDRVFYMDYWQPLHDPDFGRPVSAPGVVIHHKALKQLGAVVPEIVSGDIMGRQFHFGRFDPGDPDLARGSEMNLPGNVLLVDFESLTRVEALPKGQQAKIEDIGEPRHQALTARQLLQGAMEEDVKWEGDRVYKQGKIVYANGASVYSRTVAIMGLVGKKLGYPVIAKKVHVPPAKFGVRPLVSRTISTTLGKTPQIGQTYTDRPREKGDPTVLRRLSILEVCLHGPSISDVQPDYFGPSKYRT